MIAITKEECRVVRKECPNVFIYRTVKQKSDRHKYYMTESAKAMSVIRRLRGEERPKKDNPKK